MTIEYRVVRTTTEKLQDSLTEYLHVQNRERVHAQLAQASHVGGRDWVLLFSYTDVADDGTPVAGTSPLALEPCPEHAGCLLVDARHQRDILSAALVPERPRPLRGEHTEHAGRGWVADQDRRHARFDAALPTRRDLTADDDRPVADPTPFMALVDPEVEWGDLRYGRYDTNRVPTGRRFTGWVEDRAQSWVVFLGAHGAPALYWPRRDELGGVIGEPVVL